jgi:uncharacterized membrane protein (DUF106 family)
MILGVWDAIGDVVEYFYGFLDSILGFIWDWPGIYAVFVVSIVVGIVSVSVHFFMVDQKKLKEIREEVNEYNKRMMQARKSGNKKDLRKLEAKKKRISQLNAEMMGMTTKPLFLTIVPIMIFFGWVRAQPEAVELIIDLPFTLPFFGDSLGWLGWYILCSFFFSQTFR